MYVCTYVHTYLIYTLLLRRGGAESVPCPPAPSGPTSPFWTHPPLRQSTIPSWLLPERPTLLQPPPHHQRQWKQRQQEEEEEEKGRLDSALTAARRRTSSDRMWWQCWGIQLITWHTCCTDDMHAWLTSRCDSWNVNVIYNYYIAIDCIHSDYCMQWPLYCPAVCVYTYVCVIIILNIM